MIQYKALTWARIIWSLKVKILFKYAFEEFHFVRKFSDARPCQKEKVVSGIRMFSNEFEEQIEFI